MHTTGSHGVRVSFLGFERQAATADSPGPLLVLFEAYVGLVIGATVQNSSHGRRRPIGGEVGNIGGPSGGERMEESFTAQNPRFLRGDSVNAGYPPLLSYLWG